MHFNYVSLFVRMSEKSADVTDGSERIFHLVPTFKKRREEGKTRVLCLNISLHLDSGCLESRRIITSDFKCAVYQQFYF